MPIVQLQHLFSFLRGGMKEGLVYFAFFLFCFAFFHLVLCMHNVLQEQSFRAKLSEWWLSMLLCINQQILFFSRHDWLSIALAAPLLLATISTSFSGHRSAASTRAISSICRSEGWVGQSTLTLCMKVAMLMDLQLLLFF